MDQSERRNRIVEYLRIKPISHGQVYTFQIALPSSELKEVPSQRREEIGRSLTEQGTNLIPLIVRRTEAYSEEEEYEVVYGTDWCLVAKELDIERLWVWVFDMTDEQAAVAKAEMEQLLGLINEDAPPNEIKQLKSLVQKLEKSFQDKTDNLTKMLVQLSETSANNPSATVKNTDIANFSEYLEKVVETKLELTLQKILQPISESIKDVVNKLTTQKENIHREVTKSKPVTSADFESSIYGTKTIPQLKKIAKEKKLKITSKMRKDEIIAALEKSDRL